MKKKSCHFYIHPFSNPKFHRGNDFNVYLCCLLSSFPWQRAASTTVRNPLKSFFIIARLFQFHWLYLVGTEEKKSQLITLIVIFDEKHIKGDAPI